MSLWKWSQTANTNAQADSSINYREGQSARSLNNSARAMMAAIAKYRDDSSGDLVTAGTDTAFTVTTNQTITELVDGFAITVRMDDTNGVDATLNVDSTGDKPIAGVYGTAIPEGALPEGSIHTFVYNATDEKWIVHGRFADSVLLADIPDLLAIEALSGTSGALTKTAANTWALDNLTTNVMFAKDNNGSVFATGIAGDFQIPFACTITGVFLLADQTGSMVIDLWKDTYANYPPTDIDTITASAPVTISSTNKATDTTLTGWTTSVAAGDIIRVNIDSVTAITRFTLVLRVKRYA